MYNSQEIIENELGINNCGTQYVIKDHAVERTRIDYTLMYLSQGSATVVIGEQMHTLYAGDAMLFLPNARQKYYYKKSDKCINKFIHFSGSLCHILDAAPARVIHIHSRNEFESNFDRLVRAYCRIDKTRTLLCEGYLRIIIALLIESENLHAETVVIEKRMVKILNLIHSHINEDIDLDECAKMCYLSRDHFNHLFKKQFGCSPVQYRNKIRIERAKQLLSDNHTSISECADALGFSDVNYFYRLFKKICGISPAKYKQLQNHNESLLQ